MDRLGLSLLVGPANAGKVALLLERFLVASASEPFLIVPNRSDVDRVERDLLARSPALFGGSIGTFDDLFIRIAKAGSQTRPVATEAQRALIVRRALAGQSLNGLGRSARFGGFADALLAAVGELESGLLDPADLDGELAPLYAAYRAELDRLGLWDRDLERRFAAERLASELGAWDGRPVFAYGFEDLTGAEWALLQALAGRSDVTVSIPYEPGRAAFESLRRTMDDLSALADGHIETAPRRAEAPAARGLPRRRHLAGDDDPVREALELEVDVDRRALRHPGLDDREPFRRHREPYGCAAGRPGESSPGRPRCPRRLRGRARSPPAPTEAATPLVRTAPPPRAS